MHFCLGAFLMCFALHLDRLRCEAKENFSIIYGAWCLCVVWENICCDRWRERRKVLRSESLTMRVGVHLNYLPQERDKCLCHRGGLFAFSMRYLSEKILGTSRVGVIMGSEVKISDSLSSLLLLETIKATNQNWGQFFSFLTRQTSLWGERISFKSFRFQWECNIWVTSTLLHFA